MLPQLRRAVWDADIGQAIYHEATLDSLVAANLAMAALLSRFLSGSLFSVSTTDPATHGQLALLMLAIAALAAWLPARRAGRTSPLEALRSE